MSSRRHKHESHKHEGHKHHEHKPMPMPTMMPSVQPMPAQRLAEATVPYQVYMQIWDPRTALRNGTIFPELYRPYGG